MHRSVLNGTKGRLLFKTPMPEAVFLEILSICTFQVEFSSIYAPRDLVDLTFLMESLSIVINGFLLKVLTLYLDPSNINSVLDLLRVSLFAVSH